MTTEAKLAKAAELSPRLALFQIRMNNESKIIFAWSVVLLYNRTGTNDHKGQWKDDKIIEFEPLRREWRDNL